MSDFNQNKIEDLFHSHNVIEISGKFDGPIQIEKGKLNNGVEFEIIYNELDNTDPDDQVISIHFINKNKKKIKFNNTGELNTYFNMNILHNA